MNEKQRKDDAEDQNQGEPNALETIEASPEATKSEAMRIEEEEGEDGLTHEERDEIKKAAF